jgi:hypothetical protein
MFTVRTIRNIQIHPVGRMESFGMLKQVVHIITIELQWVKCDCQDKHYLLNQH